MHLSIYFLVISMTSLVRCLPNSLAHFFYYSCLTFLSLESSLYILDTTPQDHH